MWCCMDSYTDFDGFPCSVACEHSGFDVCKGRWLPLVATIRGRHKEKKRLNAPRGEKARRRRGGHHTLDMGSLALALASLTICCKTSMDKPGTDIPGEMQYMWSSPTGANLKTGIPIPYLRSYTLCTCARKSMVGTTYVLSVPSPRKFSCGFAANTSHSGAKRRPISRHSGDLD